MALQALLLFLQGWRIFFPILTHKLRKKINYHIVDLGELRIKIPYNIPYEEKEVKPHNNFIVKTIKMFRDRFNTKLQVIWFQRVILSFFFLAPTQKTIRNKTSTTHVSLADVWTSFSSQRQSLACSSSVIPASSLTFTLIGISGLVSQPCGCQFLFLLPFWLPSLAVVLCSSW